MGHHRDMLLHLGRLNRDLRSHIPQVFDAFKQSAAAAMGDGALSKKHKELIAMVVAVTTQCDGCLAAHARGAADAGATPDEVAEAIGVAIFMNGGPGTVYGPRAWEAYHEFRERKHGRRHHGRNRA